MFISNIPAAKLATVVAGLVREGVTFRSTPDDNDGNTFTIELTGGH